MKREQRKLPEQELKEIQTLLVSVRESIQDNNQNIKDALELIQRIEVNLGIEAPKPRTILQRIRNLLSTK